MIWDALITVGSLSLAAYFVIIEPLINRWREWRGKQEAQEPKPRYAPVTPSTPSTPQQETDSEKFERLLGELAAVGTDTPPSTSTQTVPTGTADTPDTKAVNSEYQRVLALVSQGYSGNQICGMVGGKRAEVLALVKAARADVGVTR
jgi:hypothetical protein